MKHIMLDLETLSSEHNAAIVAIGASTFSLGGESRLGFYKIVDPVSSQRHGLHIDAATVKWWMQQSQAARDAAFGKGAGSLSQALFMLNSWVHSPVGDVCVWGNGATFDNVVLRNAYKAAGIAPFWSYKGDRCYRTMRAMLKTPDDDIPFVGEKHNALDDATHQAKQLIHCMKARNIPLE